MADGKTHAAFATVTATCVTAAAFYHIGTLGPAVSFGLAFGAWLELVIDPDLDHHYVTESEQKVLRFHRTLGHIWMFMWRPYERDIAHRSRYSHSWPTGTAIRFVYALWLPIIACLILLIPWLPTVILFWSSVFVGLSLGDLTHLALDFRPKMNFKKKARAKKGFTKP